MHLRKDFEIFGKTVTAVNTGRSDISGGVYNCEYDGAEAYILSEKSVGGSFDGTPAAVIERGEKQIPIIVPTALYGTDICYECNIAHTLGSLLRPGDRLYTKFEKTCGAVMFTFKDNGIKYLIIKNESGHIGFPKGHIEYGETELETAKREVKEETGLDFIPFGDFREVYTFSTKENCIKTGTFFISRYEYRPPEIQEEEILDDWLLSFDDAMTKLNFPEDRELLVKANKYILSVL